MNKGYEMLIKNLSVCEVTIVFEVLIKVVFVFFMDGIYVKRWIDLVVDLVCNFMLATEHVFQGQFWKFDIESARLFDFAIFSLLDKDVSLLA